MALFGSKKKDTKKEVAGTKKAAAPSASSKHIRIPRDIDAVLIGPRITEKATDLTASNNIVVFNVLPSATKSDVARAVREAYSVTPVKVRVASVPRKTVTRRGKKGVKGGGKKAYVYLKKGDSINIY